MTYPIEFLGSACIVTGTASKIMVEVADDHVQVPVLLPEFGSTQIRVEYIDPLADALLQFAEPGLNISDASDGYIPANATVLTDLSLERTGTGAPKQTLKYGGFTPA